MSGAGKFATGGAAHRSLATGFARNVCDALGV